MLNIAQLPIVTRRIDLIVTGPDGKPEDQGFSATFRVLPVSATSDECMATDEGQRAVLREALLGVDDVDVTVDGKHWTLPQLVDALFDRLEVRAALFRGYFAARAEAARGN